MTLGWLSRAAARCLPHRAGNQLRVLLRRLLRQQDLLDRHDPFQDLIAPAPHPPQAALPNGSPSR